MGSLLKNLALMYGAGTLGGMANAGASLLFTKLGIYAMLGLKFGAAFSPGWLYRIMVWGGIWGAMLFLPISGGVWARGFVIGLGPSLVAGLLLIPMKMKAGIFGIEMGWAMPAVILVVNWIWGAVTVAVWKTFQAR